MKILVINPGSTTTKVAVYEDEQQKMVHVIAHPTEMVNEFKRVTDQLDFRKNLILELLAEEGIDATSFDAVVGRGGLSRPFESGVYNVNDKMVHDMLNAEHQHACDLGCILAKEIAALSGCQSFIADPGRVDELNEYARICGSPKMERICIWHALNQRAIARRHAAAMGTRYEDLNLIICHLGGGISVAAHDHGRAVDVNNALDGEGPFSPERAGSLPAADLIHLCFSGQYTEHQLLRRIAGKAGLNAHLGTNDMREAIRRIEAGDKHADLIVNAMIYHIAKSIAAQGAVLMGKVDGILLTGGIAYSDYITSRIRQRVEYLAPVYIYPGEDEMLALAQNALSVLRGEVTPKEYI